MEIKILCKKTGLNPKIVFESETETPIVDFAFVSNGEFFLLTENSILLVKDGEINPYGAFTFENASSIEWKEKTKKLYVAQNGGRQIFEIANVQQSPSPVWDTNQLRYMESRLCKLPQNLKTKIKIDKFGNVFLLVKEANRVFKKSFSSGILETIVGNGYATYCQTKDPGNCSLNFPEAFDEVDGRLVICDSGNSVIREYDNKTLKTVFGNAQAKLIHPTNIFATKDFIYFSSKNVYIVNNLNTKNKLVPIYTTQNNTMLSGNKKETGTVYILETYGN